MIENYVWLPTESAKMKSNNNKERLLLNLSVTHYHKTAYTPTAACEIFKTV